MKITTKTGDLGETSINQKRVLKSSPLIEALGELDELSACFILIANQFPQYTKTFQAIVQDCSHISAILAQYHSAEYFDKKRIDWIEEEIGKMDNQNFGFRYPFDNLKGAYLNWLRTIIRKSERSLWKLQENELILSASILIYFNRLSDYIYLLSIH